MGEAFERTAGLDARFHLHTYGRKPVLFVRGEGMRLYDDDGREYLDFVGAIGSVNLGHAHPAVRRAVCEQMGELVLASNLFHTPHRGELAEKLVGLHGTGARVFFGNSGAEANEAAIKLARKWGKERRGPDCVKVVAAQRAFHGRTLATLAATGQGSKQAAFEPLPSGFSHVPLNDLTALDEAVDERTCALMLEPIQGEAGVYPCEPEYLRGAAALCEERDVLLVLDEVQTGVYRTGAFLAHHAHSVRPDVVTLAKSLANGLPIGAMIASERVAEVFGAGDHGSTFGGGPVVCAAALATLKAHAEERTGENATRTGAYIREGLERLSEAGAPISEVRGRGLMVGVTLGGPHARSLAARALERGLVINDIGSSILRFLPPLVCTVEEADILLRTLGELLEEVAA